MLPTINSLMGRYIVNKYEKTPIQTLGGKKLILDKVDFRAKIARDRLI